MREIEVVAAVVLREGRVFCARRPSGGETGGKWEFPGGKIEPGESPEAALAREMREEFGAEVAARGALVTVRHAYASFSIVLRAYLAELVSGELRPVEHLETRWLAPEDLGSLDWAAADLPVAAAIRARSDIASGGGGPPGLSGSGLS